MGGSTEEAGEPSRIGADPVGGLLRQARRSAGLSQRELAERAGVGQPSVARMERGVLVPSVPALAALLHATGLWLVVVEPDGSVLRPDTPAGADTPATPEATAPSGPYPDDLDRVVEPVPVPWWARYGLIRPPRPDRDDQVVRAARRAMCTWMIRAAEHRGKPLPPEPRRVRLWRGHRETRDGR